MRRGPFRAILGPCPGLLGYRTGKERYHHHPHHNRYWARKFLAHPFLCRHMKGGMGKTEHKETGVFGDRVWMNEWFGFSCLESVVLATMSGY